MSIQHLAPGPTPFASSAIGPSPCRLETERRCSEAAPPLSSPDNLVLGAPPLDAIPYYPSLFGSASWVQNGRDPNLLMVVQKLVAHAPELQNTTLAGHVQTGHLGREDIRAVQRFLSGKGFQCGSTKVDGLYGPLSHQALKAYLESPGVSSPSIAAPPASPAVRPEALSTSGGATTVLPLNAPLGALSRLPLPANPPVTTPRALEASLPLPPRSADAPGGSDFMARIRDLPGPEREQAVLQAILGGNVPEFLRSFKTLPLTYIDPQGHFHRGEVRVLPDYLAVGSSQDFVRIPMTPRLAQQLADRLGCSLPTRKLVDAIYQQAELKVPPSPLPAGPQMTSLEYALRHQQQLDRQMAGAEPGLLVAGHKKDVVITNRLAQNPGRVAIYGWHRPNGNPIQGLSTVHKASYADYSHGIRLVAGTMRIDGVERPIAEILRDPALAGMLSDEGVMQATRYST